MKIGIAGYQRSGKSTLFHWLTGVPPDPAQAHTGQHAMATVPDERAEKLAEIYHAKKLTHAALDLVDTPGLSRTHEGSAARLAKIREAGCLVLVVAAYGDSDPAADLQSFEEDLLLADLEIVSGRVERLREAIKKPRPTREQDQTELEALQPLLEQMEQGRQLRDVELTPQQQRTIRAFQLFSEKPRFVIVNTADDEDQPQRWLEQLPAETDAVAIPLSLQLELSQMPPEQREEFCAEMGVTYYDRAALLRRIMDASGQMLFFTASQKEVRTWMIRKGTTAVEAAGQIHTDLARGFVRAETMTCDDLIRLGSEREVKAQHLMRHEPKNYIVQEGDILHILSSV